MMANAVRFGQFLASNALNNVRTRVFVGPQGSLNLEAKHFTDLKCLNFPANKICLKPMQDDKSGVLKMEFFVNNKDITDRYIFTEFKTETSRNMGVIRTDLLSQALTNSVPSSGDTLISVVIDDKSHALPAGLAVAKTFYLYSKKTNDNNELRTIFVDFIICNKSEPNYDEIQNLSESVRTCQKYVDMPCSELNSDVFVSHAVALIDKLKNSSNDDIYSIDVIKGSDLQTKGFGGIWGVGKAAQHLPALCVLSRKHKSKKNDSIAFVGKGIMYDTGGLSIKPTTSMCSMKHDMGGAAAVLTAFEALSKVPISVDLHALLCIAENAVGPLSVRNDDILTMHSGKSVEINNTDAEGRLVLADGVSFASKTIANCKLVVTIATLTGAQMTATGLMHAGVLASTKSLEDTVMMIAKSTCDLAFPLLYAPEILKKQFNSVVADMKNSVKDRTNAPSSAAGHFIESHLSSDYKGEFLHIDIAGPCSAKERATGYGTALLYQLVNNWETK